MGPLPCPFGVGLQVDEDERFIHNSSDQGMDPVRRRYLLP
jgi:hypothetical protein